MASAPGGAEILAAALPAFADWAAVDALDEEGRLARLALARGDPALLAAGVITVRDTGVGIPAEQIDVLFEPFVQVGRALNNPREGTGLGLTISRDLARGMGGDLTVESECGVGSRFTLTLPAA